jgi:site-specific recombinase XerD
MIAVPSMQELVQEYLQERRSLGFELKISGEQLMAFARFADQRGHCGALTEQVIMDWVRGQAKRVAPITWARRLEVIRPFARYCARVDSTTHVPHNGIFGPGHRRLTPHIYTDQEIADLIDRAGQLHPLSSLRPATYATLFGLIASTGLRLSEALKLQYPDVDLVHGVLTVRRTKFAKSRLVPLHTTVTSALSRYVAFRQQTAPSVSKASFFATALGAGLVKRTVHCVFDKLRTQLGWVARGSHPAPRIHDLRHTFICRRVQLWHEHGVDIDNAMLALSTYVGHAKVSDTYWYLTAVPELMAVAGRSFEDFAHSTGRQHHG